MTALRTDRIRRASRAGRLLPLALAMLAAAAPLRAQDAGDPAAPPPRSDPTIAGVEASLREVTDGAHEEPIRAQLLTQYTEALEQLRRASEASARAADFARQAAEAPALLATIRAELAASPPAPQPEVPPAATLPDLERSLAAARAELEAARRQSEDLQKEGGRRDERRGAIATQLVELRRRLAAADETLKMPAPGDEPAAVQAARRTQIQATRAALVAEIGALEQEEASYTARRELLAARRDRALRRVPELELLAAAWERLTNERRQADAKEAEREAKATRESIARQHPALKAIADRNAELAGMRTGPGGLARLIADVTAEGTEASDRLTRLRERFRRLRKKVELSGLSKATGVLLRQHREELPAASKLRRRLRAIDDLADEAEYAQVMRQEERDAAGDIDAAVKAVMESVGTEDPSVDVAQIESVAAQLATARRDLLATLITDYGTYVDRLVALDATLRDLLETGLTQRAYVEERILWVRSVMGPRVPNPRDAASGLAWLAGAEVKPEVAAPGAWVTALRRVGDDLWPPGRGWLGGALVVALLVLRHVGRRDLPVAAAAVSSYRTDTLWHSVRALLDTIAVALTWPAVLFFVGWLLARSDGTSSVAASVGEALQTSAYYVLLLELTRQLVRSRGLADSHFRWPPTVIIGLRRQLRWFLPVSAPLVVIVLALDQTSTELWNDSLGRMTFCVAMVLLATFVHGVVRPHGPVMRDGVARIATVHRLRLIWYPATALAPIALLLLALAGYYYTALRLAQQLIVTGGLILVLVVIRGMLLRWLYIARRRLALEEARRRRAQARDKVPSGGDTAPFDEARVNIPAIDVQTQRLFRTVLAIAFLAGLFIVWSEVLPALRVLDRVQIWPSIALLEDTADAGEPVAAAAAPADAAAPANGPPPVAPAPAATSARPTMPIPDAGSAAAAAEAPTVLTLADVGFALVILLVTIAAVRNLPGVVEIVVLQRLPLDPGSRYALTTIIRYLILAVGFLAASGALQVSWSKVQWLVAALMFGLAFGLQEIFANLVSGLIILAERPIRVGDAVTVGGVTGTVTRIRARATTVTDWDRKELVVPNKAFVTDQIVNWTLSDPMLRLVVPVGVSYGADIDKTEALLLDIGRNDPSVMKEPPPQVVFREFGDSSLGFELRVFIPHIEHLVPTRHRLHRAITQAFRASGIEIAFPQRDLHIRSAEGLGPLVQKREQLAMEELPDVR